MRSRADRSRFLVPLLTAAACLAVSAAASWAQADILITKEPDTQEVSEGESADFTITVTNPSDTETLNNVRLEDLLTPSCEGPIRDLPPLESDVVNCSTGPLFDGFTNTVTARAQLDGMQVEASDSAEVTVVTPEISITKEPDFQQVASGDAATFTITVFSPTCDNLTEVDITDPQTPDCERADETIDCEDSLTYTCTTGALFADLANVATVTALAGGEIPVSASDDAFVQVLGPGIQITKGPEIQQVVVGSRATFNVVVTNSGDLPLTDIVITDPLTPDCALSVPGPLAPSASIEYSCETDALTDALVNEIDVVANWGEGTVEGSDTADVVVVEPSIEITKVPDETQVLAGDTVEFTVTVKNLTPEPQAPIPPPSATLTRIDVNDPATPSCSRPLDPEPSIPPPPPPLGDLAPGEMHVYTCTTLPLGDDLTNVITVTAETDTEVPVEVSDEDTAFVDVVDEIDLVKEPSEQAVPYGGTATFTITVTNPNEITVSMISVEDPLAPDCNRANVGPLGPGESAAPYDCTFGPVTEDFTNVATATGDDELSGSDSALVRVTLPSIEITKEPAGQSVAPGGQASFSITLTNPGPGLLTGVEVSDPQSPDCDRAVGDLPSGSSFGPYACQSGAVDADFTNRATVTAASAAGAVSAEAEAFVNVLNPIEIIKDPPTQAVPSGGTASFEITVSNNGDEILTNVVVTDPLAADCDRSLDDLPGGGGSISYVCEQAGVTEAFTNEATVTAQGAESGEVQASDTAVVELAPVVTCAETPTATGTGTAELCFTGGGPDCSFDSFFDVTAVGIVPPPPAGLEFPHGLFDLAVVDCEPGSTLDFTLTLPTALPPGSEYYKLGPTLTSPADVWYVLPSTIDGNIVTFSITDGQLGDRDLLENGRVEDPSGPAAPVPLPTLPVWGLILLALGLAAVAVRVVHRGRQTR